MILSSAKIQKKKNLNHQIETQKLPRMEEFPPFSWKTRQVYNGPWAARFITANLSVYQYFFEQIFEKNNFWSKKKRG